MDKTKTVSNLALISTAVGVSLLSLMMSQQLGWFSFAFVLCCSLYRLWLIDNNNYNASKWLSKLFYLLAVVLVVSSAISGNFVATLLSMLVVAQGLTLLSLKQIRGLFTICWVQFFLTTASMIYLQSMHLAFVLFALNFLLLFAIYSVYQPSSGNQVMHIKKVAQLAVVALPICIVLFVLMPRLPPLWKMPKPPSETRGLQEQLKLGDIARLSRSEELAFRVTFDSQAVPREQMYWRALTLDRFDGETWGQSEQKSNITKVAQLKKLDLRHVELMSQNQNEQIGYHVIAEASYQPWLFSLDLGFSQDNNVLHMFDFSLIYHQNLRQKLQYSAYSELQVPLTESDNFQSTVGLDAYLQLPTQTNPKTESWLKALQQLNSDNTSLIAAVLDYFNQQSFYYTLSPSRLTQPIMDDFLFNTREGFCEHYASAFAYIMRLAGIPSRLVIGYLGGEHNPSGNYYSVYQFDAHAWVEINLQGHWQRIDPTSYVAPERITQNLQQTVGRDEFLPDSLFSLYHYDQIPFVNDARLLLANIDYQWTRWILNYDIDQQKKLLRKLFGDTQKWHTLMLAAVVIIILVLIILVALWLNRTKQAQHYWLVEYHRACKVLKLLNIENHVQLTPRQILTKLHDQSASTKQSWQEICVVLDKILYQQPVPNTKSKNNKQLKQAVNKFVRNVRKQQSIG